MQCSRELATGSTLNPKSTSYREFTEPNTGPLLTPENFYVKFDVFMAVSMKITIFGNVTSRHIRPYLRDSGLSRVGWWVQK